MCQGKTVNKPDTNEVYILVEDTLQKPNDQKNKITTGIIHVTHETRLFLMNKRTWGQG